MLSLTTPLPTDSKGVVQQSSAITEEAFYSLMDAEIAKTASFTLTKVTELRSKLETAESKIRNADLTNADAASSIKAQADEIADYFLRLEKYVNINFMGFHKILKKHDKYCPATPCKTFYINRMHSQAWVRGDYSDVVVRLSAIYSALRKDHTAEEKADPSQSFLRTTTKYWVKTEDVSRVKYAILKNLPVFLQKTSTGDSDSQLTNSVYLDNDQLELYHGRLVKAPGSIALRLRWYGAAEPTTVFVERKTHRDKWVGEVSVKERFMVRFSFYSWN
jgi:SPX domain protein involved in polyphosphate accumulation